MAYTAHTFDGGVIFRADTHQQLADGVARHLREGRKPALGFTYVDGLAFPYTVWVIDSTNTIVGTSYQTFGGVADYWDRATDTNT